ncbi:hypothetical protein PAXRUDRAFT_716216 [Paxillus rubicundulus Ve08.2h10]|uniref:Uncharacterized protein n=1 Tax=Paxillus rubicundulus Ve08.2h10 TaxID=930991 RepID=A0A0D0CI99_9AGAM|nr:hypothetical protein PAXRUDRAFT_716216 [Paxillus rubicundulus Ve08.2h10]
MISFTNMSDSDARDLFPKAIRRPRPRVSVMNYRADKQHTSLQAQQWPDPDFSSDHDSHSSSRNDAASLILSGVLKGGERSLETDTGPFVNGGMMGFGQGCPTDSRGRYLYSQMGQRSHEISSECHSETTRSAIYNTPLAVVSTPVGEPQARRLVLDDIKVNMNLKRGRSPSENTMPLDPETPRHSRSVTEKLGTELLPNLHRQKRRRRLGPAFELDTRSSGARIQETLDIAVREVGKVVQKSLDRQTEVLSAILEVIRSKNE